MNQQEFFKINGIDVGFGSHPVEGTVYSDPKALSTEVFVRKGKLRINLLTPSLQLTEALHNGVLEKPVGVDWVRFVTYADLAISTGRYDTQIECPYGKGSPGFEVYGFPKDVRFYGVIDIQEGYVHIRGELRPEYESDSGSIPVEIFKYFDPKPLLPERESLTFKEALKRDPLEVYELRIGGGTFDAFPEQILSFKNLEKLWVGVQAQLNCESLPDAFYELSRLHTLQIYGCRLNRLSHEIARLSHLEELAIESGQLTEIPAEIGLLIKVQRISFRNNKLISLPESIGRLPVLKELDIEGNRFRDLPKNLAGVPGIKVDRKYKKFFAEVGYKSKNPNSVDESLFDLSRYPDEREQLAAAVDAVEEAHPYKDFILDCSTMGTYLVHDEAVKEIPLGASKVGGAPDLPRDWTHPANETGELYLFHAQINCEEAAPYQHYLPRQGMLYFFVNDEEYAEKALVLYAEDSSRLKRCEYKAETEFTDSDFNDNIRSATAVYFVNAISLPNAYNASLYGAERYPKYARFFESLEETEQRQKRDFESVVGDFSEQFRKSASQDNHPTRLQTHCINTSVFTQHESPQEQAAARFGGEPGEWMVLLCMESTGEFNFWDAGSLTYCIHKKDLAIADFNTIHSSIESS